MAGDRWMWNEEICSGHECICDCDRCAWADKVIEAEEERMTKITEEWFNRCGLVEIHNMGDNVDPCYGMDSTEITEEQLEELKKGKVAYFTDSGYEYAHIVRMRGERMSEWIVDNKPKKHGRYLVTLDTYGGEYRFVDMLYYGIPHGYKWECWFNADNEWGDVPYDDGEIIAWKPLPTPYTESEGEE